MADLFECLLELVSLLEGRAAIHGLVAVVGAMIAAGVVEFVLAPPLNDVLAFVAGMIGFFLFLALSLLAEEQWHRIRQANAEQPSPACGRGQGEGC